MPDTERPSEPAEPQSSSNLPAPISGPKPRDTNDNLLSRWMRTIFGWRSGSTRADLKEVLEESTPSDLGFSPEEGTMLKNILGLRERRIDDVMAPRAHIIAVEQDIPLGELVKVFEKAGHSRLVVFHDTLDDPVGMVHIRDLVAYVTERATIAPKPRPKRKKKPVEGTADQAAEGVATDASAEVTTDFPGPVVIGEDLLAIDVPDRTVSFEDLRLALGSA